ncbi:pyrroline-5-carboxylate reductase [Aquibacillus sp. 3ASR75-11]|uniref:Pyrroline-5-carboxylate reductase n=1 Tax=Terrihalobacillus insolitus TaxID=2950438 RepID=A0A9X3WUD8_9BACI|nr:pyrroline-5-carboxylate reductase [Terrihalobacillus insolitus]MDC3415254.1 pyrroline-5-carboxylate reductase [Terrihalobacillus insolitus]MDC3426102.1 pyrroline-5-carboxylate reductase [Terrihalobacillus insolitus]
MFKKVSFVGAGSMAEAIITGMLAKGFLKSNEISVTNKENKERLERLVNLYQVDSSSDRGKVIKGADIVILSMKPKDIKDALHAIKGYIEPNQIVVSVLAGVSTDYISVELGLNAPVVRAMPNTSATIGCSATAIAGGKYANNEHIEKVKELFQTIGTTAVVDEADLHAITGLSGSGPAYIYYFAEAMEQAAKDAGINEEVAKELIIQTFVGAAQMLKTTKEEPAVLRKKITSPGGTTQAGVETLEKYKSQEALIACIKQAGARSVELGSAFQARSSTLK